MDEERYTNPVYKTWRALLRKEEAVGFHNLSDAEQVFWRIYLLDLEVWNGYYDQYFVNSSSDYADGIVAALQAIGADKAARITEAAIRFVFPTGVVPTSRTERLEHLQTVEAQELEYSHKEGELGKAYCNEAEDVYPLLQTWAQKHGFLIQ